MLDRHYDGVILEDKWGKTYLCSNCLFAYADLGEDCVSEVKDLQFGRYFLQALEPHWNQRDIWAKMYQHAKPWQFDLSKLTTFQLRDDLIKMFAADEMRIWQLTEGWGQPPEDNGIGEGGLAPATNSNTSSAPAARTAKPGGGVAAEETTTAKAAAHEAKPALKPYEGDKVFKKAHLDGSPSDPYTLMADGLPQGAKEGQMPKHAAGLEEFPEEYIPLLKEGFPDVVSRNDFRNFSDIEPKVLPPGSKIYRLVDEGCSEAKGESGCYWATELPKGKAAWRGDYAVKDSWNDNGYYVEHTVGDEGLKVWQGKTAGQGYRKHKGKTFYLEGGETQLYVGYNEVPNLKPKLTNWADA
ncbi:hypothetical protein HRH59_05150 [Rheinheimera sp. YQF-2]|uniref:Uncharacterized protein n=1 Tax=Rheinheimera lutimaris TaxID=2740584 RepID=A0A7Y5AP86_9GAMM|nr:hypothetical protein [Rheinheimera lutimaris]NRQ41962.1 hypothetical protein [Rheinheimera lutimaris]